MDTTHNNSQTEFTKEAMNPKLILLIPFLRDLVKSSLPLAITGGAVVGSTLGMGASMLKSKNPEIIEMQRKKNFYESKIREMRNEKWLDDIMRLKKRLESEKLTDADRKTIETEYTSLLNK